MYQLTSTMTIERPVNKIYTQRVVTNGRSKFRSLNLKLHKDYYIIVSNQYQNTQETGTKGEWQSKSETSIHFILVLTLRVSIHLV